MKKYIFLISLFFVGACGQQEKDLATLKKEKLELEAQIAELEKKEGQNNERRLRSVAIQTLKSETFEHFIDIQGRVDAENNVAVTAKMPGTLTSVLVKNGSYVKKGQLIASLDDGVMQKSIAELETQLAMAKDLYERQKQLWDQKIGTEVQFIQARTQVEALERRMATSREQLGQSQIYAPISGTIDMVNLKVGQAISPGFPLCQIVNLGDLKIIAKVPEVYIPLIKKNAAVNVFFPDLDKEVSSRVTYVGQSIDPMTRTFQIECSLPNNNNFRPNMIAVLRITDYSNKNALVIPIGIIQADEKGDFVLVAEKTNGNEALVRKTNISIGKSYNGKVEVLDGVNPGDHVITLGWQDVNPNETVKF